MTQVIYQVASARFWIQTLVLIHPSKKDLRISSYYPKKEDTIYKEK
jgi:hypothetical protein